MMPAMKCAFCRSGAASGLAVLLFACAGSEVTESDAPDYVPGPDYHILMAEIAQERGDYFTAAQEYLTAAELSPESEAAKRATA